MNYTIYGTYRGEKEEIDTADSLPDARYLRSEYQIAFGPGWGITIKKDSLGVSEEEEDTPYW